MQKSLIQCI